MKKKCPVCNRGKGKRGCRLHEMKMVCPHCCANIRNADCEPCFYYDAAKKYQAKKFKKSAGRSFIVEIDEEVENQVDQALIDVEKNRLRKARGVLSRLLETHPGNHHVNYGMGVFHAFNGENNKAIHYFKKAVEIFPYLVEAHYNLGVAYSQNADVANAAISLREVIQLADPDDFMAVEAKRLYSTLAQSVHEINGTDLDTFIKAQRLFEDGFQLMQKGEWERAIAAYKASLMFIDSTPQPHGNMGICYGALGKKEEAIKAFDRALAIDPNYEPALFNKMVTEKLDPGEKLNPSVETVEYYKDYGMENRSYIREFMDKNG